MGRYSLIPTVGELSHFPLWEVFPLQNAYRMCVPYRCFKSVAERQAVKNDRMSKQSEEWYGLEGLASEFLVDAGDPFKGEGILRVCCDTEPMAVAKRRLSVVEHLRSDGITLLMKHTYLCYCILSKTFFIRRLPLLDLYSIFFFKQHLFLISRTNIYVIRLTRYVEYSLKDEKIF